MYYLCSEKRKQQKRNTMETVRTIFYTIGMIAAIIFILGLFIQTNVELWNDVGKDLWNDMKSTVISWFNNTKMGMWYKNKKNKVEILSDRKYNRLLKSGQIKNILVVED